MTYRDTLQRVTNILPSSGCAVGVVKFGLTIAFLFGPPIYLFKNPSEYLPFVDTLLNAFLFIMAFWIGRDAEVSEAAKSATQKWLPHAEAVTYRLITLFSNVRQLSLKVALNCDHSCCDLPELRSDSMKAVRTKLKADCQSASERLDDISNQLDDAIKDWHRFISANCTGAECERIFTGIDERLQRVDVQMIEYCDKLQEKVNAIEMTDDAKKVSPTDDSKIAIN